MVKIGSVVFELSGVEIENCAKLAYIAQYLNNY